MLKLNYTYNGTWMTNEINLWITCKWGIEGLMCIIRKCWQLCKIMVLWHNGYIYNRLIIGYDKFMWENMFLEFG
jgi:hypothetical protein